MARKRKRTSPELKDAAREHAETWRDCDGCGLCETRSRVVTWRGEIPADVVFVGEAPGLSEDAFGFPFIGEAGKLLDQIIAEALEGGWKAHTKARPRWAITNVVACLPKAEQGVRPPNKQEAEACRTRLHQFLKLAEPRLVVTLGKTAEKYFEPIPDTDPAVVHLIHPASILRAEGSDQTLKYRRSVVLLERALSTVAKRFKR